MFKSFRRLVLIAAAALGFVSGAAAEPITLRFVVWDGDEGLVKLREAAHDFEVAHPGVFVKLENVNYNDYFTKLLTQYAAGVAPDVAMLDPNHFQNYSKRGALLPLNPLFSSVPGFDLKEYYEPIAEASSYKGQLYVVPRDIAPFGILYYNKKAFDEAGIPYPDGTWTWDFKVRPELKEKDFMWVLQQLTKKDAKGKTTRYGLASWAPAGLINLFVYSQGARFVDDPENPTKLLFTEPRVVAAHKLLADIYQKEHWIPSPSDLSSILQATADQLFTSQKTAMYMCGIWDAVKVRRVLKPGTDAYFDWDVAMAPRYAGADKPAFPTGGSGYSVMSSTQHPKEAFALAAWMAGKAGMIAMARAGFAQPAIRKWALSEAWIPNANTPREEQDPKNRIITDTEVPFVVFDPTSSYWPELQSFLNSKQEPIWTGQLKPEEGLQEAQELATNRLTAILKQDRLPLLNWVGAGLVIAGLVLAIAGWVYLPNRRKLTHREKIENRAGYAFAAPWIIGALLFTLGPMLVSLVMSFADWDIIQPARWRGGGNYSEAFRQDPRFWKSLMITGIYTVFSVPIGIVIALCMALLLNTKVKGISVFRTCFYLPALASTVAASLVMRKVFQQDGGLLNSVIYGASGEGNFGGLATLLTRVTGSPDMANWLGNEKLALPSFMLMSFWTVGGSMVILLAGLQGIPHYYYEAATLDGASPWQRFKSVTFPLLTPSLFFVLVTGVIGSFQVFTQVFVITAGQGGPNDATRVFMIHLYDNAFKNLRMGYASALAWVLFIVIMIFTLLQFKLNKRVYYEAETR